MNAELENDDKLLGLSQKRKAYSKSFKVEAIHFAKDLSKKAAAKIQS